MVGQLKPWLWLPASVSHNLAPYALPIISSVWGGAQPATWQPLQWKGLHFPNPLGLAGGVDKAANQFHLWSRLGAGFVEVGTVTPQPQGPNPGQIMDRRLEEKALWNKMGFPGPGMDAVLANLRRFKSRCRSPVFINVGKNRHTDNARAADDYLAVMHHLRQYADVFVVNISSPNTSGLRDLLQPKNLTDFLHRIDQGKDSPHPLFLKLSPDMAADELRSALDVGCENGVDGFILTNTRWNNFGLFAHEGGGVSGGPLTKLSEDCLRLAAEHLQARGAESFLISAGGVLSSQDVRRRLELGARLVQTYSALIFEGPLFFQKVAREMGATWR